MNLSIAVRSCGFCPRSGATIPMADVGREGYNRVIAKNPGFFLLRYVSFPGFSVPQKTVLLPASGERFPSSPSPACDGADRYPSVLSSAPEGGFMALFRMTP